MKPSNAAIRLAQGILNKRANVGRLKVDGWAGPKTRRAASIWTNFPGNLSASRLMAAVIQKETSLRSGIATIKLDGYWGPDTDFAAEAMILAASGEAIPVRPDEAAAPTSKSPRCWTPTDRQMIAHFGRPGTNLGRVVTPYPIRLDWDLTTILTSFSCHRTLEDRIFAAMDRILIRYGIDGIRELGLDRFGGCVNVRKKRGGSTWSTHAFGAALDWFPSVNRLRETKRTARFARPAYRGFMDAWAAQGFMSLGRCYDFDWMHIQSNPG